MPTVVAPIALTPAGRSLGTFLSDERVTIPIPDGIRRAKVAVTVDALISLSSEVTPPAEQDTVYTLTAGDATSGTFDLIFSGEVATGLTYDESAADIETALEALDLIEDSTVEVTGGDLGSNPVTITFPVEVWGGSPPPLTIDTTDLNGVQDEDHTLVLTQAGVSVASVIQGDTQEEFIINKGLHYLHLLGMSNGGTYQVSWYL